MRIPHLRPAKKNAWECNFWLTPLVFSQFSHVTTFLNPATAMSADNDNTTPLLPYTLINVNVNVVTVDIAKNWGWILAVGIINMMAGIFALISPTAATGVIVMLSAVTLLFAGGATMTGLCFAEDGMKAHSFILGAAKAILGLLLWFYPFGSLMTITILIAVLFMLNGVFLCSVALSNRGSPTWGWTFINGVSAVVLSIIVISAFPMSSLYTVGILVGVNLVSIGMARIAIAMKGHRAAIEHIEAGPPADDAIA